MKTQAIILAAGKGTRMKSELIKVLHEVGGKPVLQWVIDSLLAFGVDAIYCVVGHQSEKIRNTIHHPKVSFIDQTEQLGTGHAVQIAIPHIHQDPDTRTLIVAGDCPLISSNTLTELLNSNPNASVTILSTHIHPPGGYGRIKRANDGSVTGIKEAKDCDKDELSITEINTGAYLFQTGALIASLSKINANNSQKEYYLTDTIHILKNEGQEVAAYCTPNDHESIGINSRQDLALVNQHMYNIKRDQLMQNGVTLIDPPSIFIDPAVAIASDTIIHPFTTIKGASTIEAHCEIGPHAYIEDETITSHNRIPPFYSSYR